MYNSSSSPSLANVIVSGNTTVYYGGGMYNQSSSPSLINVIMSGNTANFGSGMYNDFSSPSLTNTTITGNMSNKAIYKSSAINNRNSSTLSLHNSIVYGNNTPNYRYAGVIDRSGSTSSIDYSLVYGVDNTANNGLNGYINLALFNDPTNGDYSLLSTSPVVNAGSNTAYTNAGGNLVNDLDMAGNPRLYDGTPTNDNIDIGAYELQAEPLMTGPDANNILYVNKNVGGGTGQGNSWANAIPELADALVWAKLNQSSWSTSTDSLQIFVAKGTYKPLYSPEDGKDFGTDQEKENSFLMVNNVQMYGGFDPDNGIDDLSDVRIFSSPAGAGTILSADINGDDVVTGSGASLSITNTTTTWS